MVAAVAIALGVAGCGGSTHAVDSRTSSPTPTTSTTPAASANDCIFKVPGAQVRHGYRGVIFATRYGSRLGAAAVRGCWQKVQVPRSDGTVQSSRIELVRPPGSGSDPERPDTSVMRVELRPFGGGHGDVTETSGYRANRAEVYARLGEITKPPPEWPDPVGSTRWYAFSIYLPPGFPVSDDSSHWLDFTQWKGLYSGSPAIALGTKGDEIVVDGKRLQAHVHRIVTGRWMALRIGVHFSPDPQQGWMTVALDGHTVLPVTHGATMNKYWDSDRHHEVVDPSYLKQGIYRSDTWDKTAVMYFGPVRIGTSEGSVS